MDAVLIAGPTASGKSSLAMRIARESNAMIVNSDAMQVYDALRILTARPSHKDMEDIDHRLYGHVPASRAYSVGDWYRDVEKLLEEPDIGRRTMVFVGGTGLYFRALMGGLSRMPEIPQTIRQYWRDTLAKRGVEHLHARLAERDPETAAQLSVRDRQRIVRALEVFDASGRSIRSFQGEAGQPLIEPNNARRILVMPDRTILHDRIEVRFKRMIAEGAIDEVRRLLAMNLRPDLPAMKAIGVREIAAFIDGSTRKERAIELASIATRQYAKRQMTWFRNQLGTDWDVRS
ncbi:MAG: tRNA (adenosine(37)-N6)-dimethylallyltransferase MiaA [Pseudomonadota bacterium]